MALSSAEKKVFGGSELSTEESIEKKLFKDFTYPFYRVLFIWSPSYNVDPSVVATMLGRHDKSVRLNNHWIETSSSSPLKVWGGALAKFRNKNLAKTAAESIPENSRFLKVLSFKEIMAILIKAELRFPKTGKEMTKVIFKGHFPIEEEQATVFKSALGQFGNPKELQIFTERTSDGVIAEANYCSQFKAYAAKIAMDGTLLKGSGFISADILLTKNGKKFDNFVRYQVHSNFGRL